jgi:hypothetical protein
VMWMLIEQFVVHKNCVYSLICQNKISISVFLNNTVLLHFNYMNLKEEEKSSKNFFLLFFIFCNTPIMCCISFQGYKHIKLGEFYDLPFPVIVQTLSRVLL